MKMPLDNWKTAIEHGEVDTVKSLFAQHAELADHVNDQIFAFDSPAIFHCLDNLDLVDVLLAHGADINQKTGWGAGGFGILEGLSADQARPLIERGAIVDIWASVSMNDMAAARRLLDDDPGLVTAPGGDGKHPLHYAQDVEMVDLLIARGAQVCARCADHGSTPLQYQIQNRDVVFRLIEHGAEPDIFMAAYWGAIDLARRCVEIAPDCCNVRLGDGDWTSAGNGDIYKWTIEHDATPFQVARMRAHAGLVEFMMSHSSPVTRLTDAIWQGDRAAVDAVCQEDENALQDFFTNDATALTRAVWWYHPKAVTLMLDLGFDPHQPGVHDSTPLDRAAFHGYADIIETLLKHDPNPPVHQKNEFGGTPLEACLFGRNHGWTTGHPQDHVSTARLLIDAGSSVSEKHLGRGSSEIDAMINQQLSVR